MQGLYTSPAHQYDLISGELVLYARRKRNTCLGKENYKYSAVRDDKEKQTL
jgi:hypothetical protein